MTHNDPMTLEQYFHEIVNTKPIEKEHQTMFDYLKAKWAEWTTTKYEFVEDEKETLMDDDYWAFEMVTHPWVDEYGDTRSLKHTIILEPHEGTWMGVLDRILDALGEHYGYNIKEQVYYSVEFPLNELDDRTGEPFAGYGRSLNDKVLQQLLLAFPEVYDMDFKEKFTLA